MKVYDRSGQAISDWRRWTRPKKESQWRAGRSAMELARAWFTSPSPVVPQEIAALLDSSECTRGAILSEAWPETVTTLPIRGEGRNHDMVVLGHVGSERLLLTIEAKVDETMGPAIGAYWHRSKNSKTKSNAWKRVEALLAAAFGDTASAQSVPWAELPYQMLTALVGTALEANERQCSVAVLCVQELVTESANADRLKQNLTDYRAFLNALGVSAPENGKLYGPFPVRIANASSPIHVLVGKVSYSWAAR